jgi:hypothetical protein
LNNKNKLEVAKLSTLQSLDNYLDFLANFDEAALERLSLEELRQLRKEAKNVNRQLSTATEKGGIILRLIGQKINNLQFDKARTNPTETVAAKIARLESTIAELTKRSDS